MALLGAYKPKYETTLSGVAKQAPISSVVSLGLVPAIGSLAGKVLETGRAMFSDTGDPMAVVKGRTQQVAGELSDYANGKAGKPTIATPLAPANATAAPKKQADVTDIGTTFVDVVLPKMGPKDLSRLSSGALPTGKPATVVRRAPARRTGSGAATVDEKMANNLPISAMNRDALKTPDYQVPGTNNITRIDNVAPGEFNSDFGPQGVAAYNTPVGGGIASNGVATFVLRGRTPDEEAAFKTQQAQTQNAQSFAALAQPVQQTSTVGYGNGIETYGGDGNLISSTRKIDSNATMGDLMMEKFNTNQQVKRAGIANINSEISRGQALLPSQIRKNETDAYQSETAANVARFLAPSQARKNESSALHDEMSALIASYLAPAQRENTLASADSNRASAESTRLIAPTAATKNLADAAESSARLKTLLSPAKMSGMTAKEQIDVIHKGSLDAALEMMKQSTATDPNERQKEFERNYFNNVKRAAELLKSFQGA